MYEFSKRLKMLRSERNLSLEELAIATGSTKSTLSKYERGIVDPTLSVAKTISDYFGVSLDWLAGSSDEKNEHIPQEYKDIIDKCLKSKVTAAKLDQFIDIIK